MATGQPPAARDGSVEDNGVEQPRDPTAGTEQVIRMDQLQSTVETLVRQALEGLGTRALGSEGGPPAQGPTGELTPGRYCTGYGRL